MNIQNIFKYKWLEILMFLPPVIFLATVNVIGDSGGVLRNDNTNRILDYIIKGKSVQSLAGEYNEREIKRLLIQKINKNVECIALGPSLIYRIGKESVEASSFYNLGFSSANHYDLFATIAFLKINEIKYKKVIICLDFLSLFHTEYPNLITLWEPYSEYYNYAIGFLEGKQNLKEPNIDYCAIAKSFPLLSLSYFKKSFGIIKNLIKRKNIDLIEEVIKPTKETRVYLMSDGSFSSTFKNENRPESEYVNFYKRYMTNYPIQYGNFDFRFKTKTCEEFKNHFLLLIDYWKKNNVEIVFWYHPFSPIIWDKIDYKQYPGIYGLDNWSRNLAKEKGIKTVGSYNPHECGVTDDCFQDPCHLKRSAIAKYFRF